MEGVAAFLRWSRPAIVWICLSALIWLSFPRDPVEHRGTLRFLRMQALASVYFCFAFALVCRPRKGLDKIARIGAGGAALAAGFAFSWMVALPNPSIPGLPDHFLLWAFLWIYMAALAEWFELWEEVSPRASWIAGAAAFLAMASAYGSEILLSVPDRFRPDAVLLFLYTNPGVVAASCFPDFDCIRSTSLYESSPLGSQLGQFRYPDPLSACWIYAAFAAVLRCSTLFLRVLRNRKKKMLAL